MGLKNKYIPLIIVIAFFVDTAWMQKSVDFSALDDDKTPTININ